MNNLMHLPIDQRASKTKVIGFSDLQFGVGELWVHNEKHYHFLRNLENCVGAELSFFTFNTLQSHANYWVLPRVDQTKLPKVT